MRILAATDRDLEHTVAQGLFRRDLYFRLNVLSLRIPPLRERRQDIPLLATAFLERLSQPSGRKHQLSDNAMNALLAYDRPGNVRELENGIERCCAMILARKCRIYIYDLAQKLGVPVKGSGLAEGIEVFPKHDEIQEGAFGNALRGPLGIHRGAKRRFWFYGTDYTLEAQIGFLTRLRKLTEAELDGFTRGKELPPNIAKIGT